MRNWDFKGGTTRAFFNFKVKINENINWVNLALNRPLVPTFIEAAESLEIESFVPYIDNAIYPENIPEIVKNYETHPSIFKIKEYVDVVSKFIFSDITPNNFEDEICKLDPKKTSTENDIQTVMK